MLRHLSSFVFKFYLNFFIPLVFIKHVIGNPHKYLFFHISDKIGK